MKKTIDCIFRVSLLLIAMITVAPIMAQESGVEVVQRDSVVRQTSFYYAQGQDKWFEKMNDLEIFHLVLWVKENREAQVKIQGWADSSGSEELSNRIAEGRARTAQKYLIREGIAADRITYEGMGVDSQSDSTQARRADLIAYLPLICSIPQDAAESTAETPAEEDTAIEEAATEEVAEEIAEEEVTEEATPEEEEEEASVTEAAPEEEEAAPEEFEPAGPLTLRTNLAYWLGGLANIGAAYHFAETPIEVVFNAGYSPFSSENWETNLGGWFISPEVRYYLGKKEQWFIGAEFLYGGFDIRIPAIWNSGRTGNVTVGGLVGGYKIALSDRFDMDFTFGLGYGTLEYKGYTISDDGERKLSSSSSSRSSVLPMQGGINLIWKLR